MGIDQSDRVDQISTCKKGHPFDESNKPRVLPTGALFCRLCDKLKAQARRDMLRGDKPKGKKDPSTYLTHCKRGHPLEGDNVRWVDTPWGKQKQCRECIRVRRDNYRERFQRIAAGLEQPATPSHRQKEFCKWGHRMEGDNVRINPDGGGRVCKACALQRVKDHQSRNRAQYLEYKAELRRQRKEVEAESIKAAIIRIRSEHADFPVLLSELKILLKPTD